MESRHKVLFLPHSRVIPKNTQVIITDSIIRDSGPRQQSTDVKISSHSFPINRSLMNKITHTSTFAQNCDEQLILLHNPSFVSIILHVLRNTNFRKLVSVMCKIVSPNSYLRLLLLLLNYSEAILPESLSGKIQLPIPSPFIMARRNHHWEHDNLK